MVDDEDLAGSLDFCGERGHEADRAGSVDQDGFAGFEAGEAGGVPSGGEDVGEHDVVVLFFFGVLRQLQGVEVGPRDLEVFGLAAVPGAHVGEPVSGASDVRVGVNKFFI